MQHWINLKSLPSIRGSFGQLLHPSLLLYKPCNATRRTWVIFSVSWGLVGCKVALAPSTGRISASPTAGRGTDSCATCPGRPPQIHGVRRLSEGKKTLKQTNFFYNRLLPSEIFLNRKLKVVVFLKKFLKSFSIFKFPIFQLSHLVEAPVRFPAPRPHPQKNIEGKFDLFLVPRFWAPEQWRRAKKNVFFGPPGWGEWRGRVGWWREGWLWRG